MFSSINFLFLISLAIISWIVLCYFSLKKQIEDERLEALEFNIEDVFENEALCQENSDIFLKFLCICACIYAFVKATSVTEGYIAKSLYKGICATPLDDATTTKVIENLREEQKVLKLQVCLLEEQNSKLKKIISELHLRTMGIIAELINKRKNESICKLPYSEAHVSDENKDETIDALSAVGENLTMQVTNLIGNQLNESFGDTYDRTSTIEHLRTEKKKLKMQVSDVAEENSKLKRTVKELEERNSARTIELIAKRVYANSEHNKIKIIEDLKSQQDNLMKQIIELKMQNIELKKFVPNLQQRGSARTIDLISKPKVNASLQCPTNISKQNAPKSIAEFLADQKNLQFQVKRLQKQNSKLKQTAQEFDSRYFPFTSKEIDMDNKIQAQLKTNTSLLYPKKHTYINEGTRYFMLNYLDFKESSDYPQIWQKYLETHKPEIKQPTTPVKKLHAKNSLPIALSIEELKKIYRPT